MQKVVYKRRFSKYNISTIAATTKNSKSPHVCQGVVMAKYKKCPRCEINYILENEDYCEICKQELKGARLSADVESDDEDEEDADLCPVCRKNYLNDGEKVCSACARTDEYDNSSLTDDIDEEEPDVPDEDIDSSDEDDWELSLEEMQDEEFADDTFDDSDASEDDEYDEEEDDNSADE